MKELAEIFPYIGIYYLSLFMGLLVNGMPILASLIFSLILVLIVLWVWSFIYLTMFCLESKIRHSTILSCPQPHTPAFCLESKIRHSTIDTVPYFYVQRLIKKYSVRYFYQKSIC